VKITILTRRRAELDALRAEVADLRRTVQGLVADAAFREAVDRLRPGHGGER